MNRLTNGSNKNYKRNRKSQPRLISAKVARARYSTNNTVHNIEKINKNKVIVIALISLMILFVLRNNYLSAFFSDFKSIVNVFSIDAQYTVSFKSNSGSGSMEDQVISYNVDTALNQNLFTKTGYIISGWNTKADGSGTSYENGEEVRNLGNVTLYAQWKKLLTKYAVQIYGINEDEDALGNKLGLTFGPATYGNYNDSYITHEYEETAAGSGQYYVKIVTHTVAVNGSETLTTAYLKDSENNNVVRTAEEKSKYDINMHKMTWEEIAAVQDKTAFLDCMLCGDTKPIELTLNSTLGSGNKPYQYGDGSGIIYNTIDHYYTLWNPSSTQNAAATVGGTASSNAKLAGGYSSSHIRATLIGKNDKTDVAYAGDVNLTADTCLYSCIENDLKNVIVAKKIKYVTGTDVENYTLNDDLADNIWLFSDREVYGTGVNSGLTLEGLGTDGVGYSKYANPESRFYLADYTLNGTTKRQVFDESKGTLHWWLRSLSLYNDFYVRYVRSGGGLLNDYAYGYGKSGGLSFGFCIDSAPVNYTIRFDSNSGTGTMPDQSLKSTETVKLNLNTFKKSGYAFKEWNTKPDGTGKSYTDGEVIRKLVSTEGEVVTLYAQWKESHDVKYAVQIYGINQDVDANGTPLGLTFGPACEFDYKNSYVIHTYDETSPGSNEYYVIRERHIIAENNSETIQYQYLCKDGSDTEKVIRTAAEKEKYDINLHNMTWTEIANTTDKSIFLDCMLCGDTKSVTFNLNDTIASGVTFEQPGDGTGTLHDTINPYYRMWNPSIGSTEYPERNNEAATNSSIEGTNAKNVGGYSSSHLRATLVGKDSKTDESYAGNVNLDESNSLYSCMESELRNLITAKRVRYITGADDANYTMHDDIVDKIWLFSSREIYGDGLTSGITSEGIGAQGVGYDRFGNNKSRYYFSSYTNDWGIGRVNYKEDAEVQAWWVRSPSLHYDSHPIMVFQGYISCDPAFCSEHGSIAVGFCLQGEYEVSFNNNGGTGSMLNQKISNNVATNLRPNTFTREGYNFVGWNTAADGSGTSYTEGEQVNNLGNTTLFAQWKKINKVKYAVQIYGINEDKDANGNPLGLTFGPATGVNYNNAYVTHTYEETSENSGEYYIKIVTHTVAADGTETTSMEYLMDSSDNKVVRTQEQKTARENISLHEMTWSEIAAVSDKTLFEDCMLCGDTKSVTLTLNSTIEGVGENTQQFEQYGDGAGTLNGTIKDYYRIWNPNSSQNAAIGTGVTLNSGETSNGSNARNGGGYKTSHVRASLIGKEKSNPTVGYAGDVNLSEETCLYSCIESDLQDVITPKKVKYTTGTSSNYTLNDDIADKIWLFSDKEMYGTGQNSGQTSEGLGTDGVGYSRFSNTESKYYISSYGNNSNTNRVCYTENGESSSNWWLRSPSLNVASSARDVNTSGSINDSWVSNIECLNFGFCIDSSHISYNVKYHNNSGTGTMLDQSMVSNVPAALTLNTFTRTGYKFKEWNTEPNGSGISYSDGQVVSKITSMEGAVVNLYAQWDRNPVKYAVQIYGINQDVDASGNTLGLTFGPATGEDYNNAYITHEYEEIAGNPGNYYIKIITHDVESDGSETTSWEHLKDSSGNKVIRTQAQKTARENISLHEMTWAEIAAVNDKTLFEDCMLCGDTKAVSVKLNSTIIASNAYDQYGDGAGTLASTINTYYRKWNPNPSDNPAVGTDVTLSSNEISYGSNAKNGGGYKTSHMRATLIGKEISNPTVGYAGDVNLEENTCLYSCIDNDLQSVISPKKIKYVTGTSNTNYTLNEDIADKIWLFSDREIYGTGEVSGQISEGLGTTGVGYGKFSNTESRYYIPTYTSDTNENRTCYNEASILGGWWLRSVGLNTTSGVRRVYNSGKFTSSNAYYNGFGVSFGFCIR